MPADKDLAEKLEDLGHGTVGTDIFVRWTPDSPDNAITLTQTSGSPPEPTVSLEYPNVQVRVRNLDNATGQALIANIMDDLHAITNETIETRLYSVQALGSWMYIGQDQKDRYMFSCNFMTFKAIE